MAYGFMVPITRDVQDKLAILARRERRRIRDQAAYLIERAVEESGVEEPKAASTDPFSKNEATGAVAR